MRRSIQNLTLASALALAACSEKRDPPEGTAATPPAAEGTLPVIMAGIGTNMTALHAALWREDLTALAAAAQAIADHPRVNATERGRVQKTLGEDFGAFVKHDREVHGAASELAALGRGGEKDALIEGLARLERGCVGCHAVFRARLAVDPKTPAKP